MNIYKLSIFLLFSFHVYCQRMPSVDSTSIAFKASLFTVSKYGIASKEKILQDVENQKVRFLKTKYKSFLFIKIEFSQPYRTSDKTRSTLTQNCNYYLAFNILEKRFYKLGGFDDVDIDDFINDLESQEGINLIDWVNRNEIEEIDIDCLYSYYKLNKKQRVKQNFTCFESCSQKIKTYYIEH